VRKREKEKLRQALVIQEIVDNFIFSHYITLREALAKVIAMDKSQLFLHPVSKEDVPDYYDVIAEPMSWSQIEEKLDQMVYLDTEAFKVGSIIDLTDISATSSWFSTTPWCTTSATRRSTAPPTVSRRLRRRYWPSSTPSRSRAVSCH
jgi:hypothetical protein